FIAGSRTAELIGVTRQWIGGSSAFAYRGSFGPYPVSKELRNYLGRIGNRLASAFGLVGWLGIDYVSNPGIPWPVEINPRFTASVEIHELALRQSLLDYHRRACEGQAIWPVVLKRANRGRRSIIGKEILYARRSLTAGEFSVPVLESADRFA